MVMIDEVMRTTATLLAVQPSSCPNTKSICTSPCARIALERALHGHDNRLGLFEIIGWVAACKPLVQVEQLSVLSFRRTMIAVGVDEQGAGRGLGCRRSGGHSAAACVGLFARFALLELFGLGLVGIEI